ncbi:metallophosphoesterase [uncultured Aquimarina sp.]|uniref:metallophosphoesterase n=1 Tax=uncultured Aquimarina sp. TaxID=575652 RepID=UPI00262B0561|nr:metallophosphoesterase [uncultured Aquimarina sp.]
MNIIYIFNLVLLLSTFNVKGQQQIIDTKTLNDGPYIFIEKDKLIKKEIVDGNLIIKDLRLTSYDTIFRIEKSVYKKVKNIVVLSDIHGQYDLAVELLKNNKIIDKNSNWKYNNGHLVIVGDIFDRGPKVNEMLWLVYKLEKQAKKKKGKVHFILGNHEYMILHGNLKYINDKYKKTCELLKLNYSELYGKHTILGRWLRSKPTIVKIGDNTFVHGGISKKFLSIGYDIEKTNKIMRELIDKDEVKSTDFYKTYFGENGPVWYRGYFKDNLRDNEISDILKEILSKHIVVGHCSNEKVVQLYDHKIFGVDSSIKKGEYGELLFIKHGKKYYRGTLQGKKIRFRK